MAEARDRLSRPPVDLDDAYAQWLYRDRSVVVDPPAAAAPELIRTSARQRTQPGLGFGATGVVGRGGLQRSSLRTPRTGNGRGRISYGLLTQNRENTPPAGSSSRRRGKATNSVLPSWYPRTPLQDITPIDIRLSENPVADPGQGGIPRFVLVARLAKVEMLNGSEVSSRERKE